MATPARDYRSIGEVLGTLKPEFPDVTISKIRFLEAEGLIGPERTPSGYRKFYDRDVERLRMILRLQRDEYLPLKVIRERLDGAAPRAAMRTAGSGGGPLRPAPVRDLVEEDPSDREPDAPIPATDVQMTIEEISTASGVAPEVIEQLATFGLVHPRKVGEARFYDGEALLILRIAKEFFKYGVEPRHLTMYRHFADREAAFLQSIILPILRQRNPEARRAASESLTDLADVARRLKSSLLRSNLRKAVGP